MEDTDGYHFVPADEGSGDCPQNKVRNNVEGNKESY